MSGTRDFRRATAAAWLILLSIGACSGVTVRGPDQGWEGGAGFTPDIDTDLHRNASPMYETREQCRSAPRPAGWLAIGYLQLGEECLTRDQEPYNGVLLQKVRDLPAGRIVEVCADQSVPRGWIRIAGAAESVCEGARVKDGKPTAVRIMKSTGG